MTDTRQEQDTAVIVGLTNDEADLDELEELLNTAGIRTVGRIIQPRDRPHPRHYVGKGKLEELGDFASLKGATAIVCDDELSAAQQRSLAEAMDLKILDRTMIILDIFASRANTSEGQLQVELAQLSYNLAHLTGLGKQLSRLGGGIGTRGPGEKKLETDRRHIRNRMDELESALKYVRRHRATARAQRQRNGVAVVSLVGYTNAGKSTLLNAMCGSNALAEDKLFATLDTTTRSLELPGGMRALLTDTVGFIRKLPHGLVKAFRATLEELEYSDLLLHVVDSSNPEASAQMDVVMETLSSLKCNVPVINVFNKADLPQTINTGGGGVSISARGGIGLDELKLLISHHLNLERRHMKLFIPHEDGRSLALVHSLSEDLQILEKQELSYGTLVEVLANESAQLRLANLEAPPAYG